MLKDSATAAGMYEEDVPLAPPWPGARHMRQSRYWRVGNYVIEEDEWHYTWVLGRRSIADLEQLPRALSHGSAIPRALRFASDYESLVVKLDQSIGRSARMFDVH